MTTDDVTATEPDDCEECAEDYSFQCEVCREVFCFAHARQHQPGCKPPAPLTEATWSET